MNFTQVPNRLIVKNFSGKRILFLILALGLLLFWRYSFYVFITDLDTLSNVPVNQLSPLLKAKLTIPEDRLVATHISVGDSIRIYAKIDTNLVDIKIDTSDQNQISNEAKFTYTSKTHRWKISLDEFYFSCTLVAANNKMLLVYCSRAEIWDPTKQCPGSPMGCGGPFFWVNLMVNTARDHWNDYYLINRNTGSILKRFRYRSNFFAKGVFESGFLFFHLNHNRYVKTKISI